MEHRVHAIVDKLTGFWSQRRAKLRVFPCTMARKSTQPSLSLTRKPCTVHFLICKNNLTKHGCLWKKSWR